MTKKKQPLAVVFQIIISNGLTKTQNTQNHINKNILNEANSLLVKAALSLKHYLSHHVVRKYFEDCCYCGTVFISLYKVELEL